MLRRIVFLPLMILGVLTPALLSAADHPTYPKTEKIDHVDTYHGVEVPDPYRWLETDVRESDQVRNWVDAENKVTFGYLESLSSREPIRQHLEKLWNYPKTSVPFKAGGRYYFSKNDGLQNQSVLYVQIRWWSRRGS